jgi:NAD(P)H-hydrate epimerase
MFKLTRAQVREIDRRSIEEFHLPGVVLMENAARGVLAEAIEMLGGNPVGADVLIVCGGGNNGGDGLAVARLLHNAGAAVRIALTVEPAQFSGDARVQWDVISAMRLPVEPLSTDRTFNILPRLLIDAIFGTGLDRLPRPPFEAQAEAINRSGVPVLAVDLPSGLDCDTGRSWGPCVIAARTVTFVAEKAGFDHPDARRVLGKVVVADIGCPAEVISPPGMSVESKFR